MGHFADFIQQKGIEADAILRVSERLERLRDEDRELRRKRAAARRTSPGKSYADAGLGKPRSGRPLRPGHLEAALADKPVPGPVRSKFVRAVNHLLAKKGEQPIAAPQLFGPVPGKQGKKPR